MIVSGYEIHHRPHGDHVTVGRLANDRPLDHRLGRENADFGRVDDRHGQDRPEPAGVVDGEGAALNVVEPKLVRPSSSRQILDGAVDAVDRELIGVVDDGHDQPGALRSVDGDGDADVDAPLPQQTLIGVVGVEVGVAMERLDHGLDDERQEAQPDTLASLVRVGLGAAEIDDGCHVGFERAVGDRDGGGAGHLGGNPAAHLVVGDEDLILPRLPDDGRRRRGRRGGRCQARRMARDPKRGCLRDRPRDGRLIGGSGGSTPRGRAAPLHVRHHVLTRDPPSVARADDLDRGEAVLAHQHPHGRGHARVGIAEGHHRHQLGLGLDRDRPRSGGSGGSGNGRSLGSRRLRGGRARSTPRGPRQLLDDRDLRVERHRLPLGHQDLAQDSRERRRDLGVDLVGDHLEQRLVHRHGVAGLLEPFPDRPLGHALSELWHRHLGHGTLLLRAHNPGPLVTACLSNRHAKGSVADLMGDRLFAPAIGAHCGLQAECRTRYPGVDDSLQT